MSGSLTALLTRHPLTRCQGLLVQGRLPRECAATAAGPVHASSATRSAPGAAARV